MHRTICVITSYSIHYTKLYDNPSTPISRIFCILSSPKRLTCLCHFPAWASPSIPKSSIKFATSTGSFGTPFPLLILIALTTPSIYAVITSYSIHYTKLYDAEINAIESSLEPLDGSTLYCNLEPCSKIYSGKKNSPCCDAIIKSGIKRVVIAQIDPNPHVSGSGVTLLRENGIEVITGVEQEKALELNVGFNSVMSKGRPYIHIKWAQSLDGKIAASSGVSKWISSEACRKEVHFFRGIYDAILVGRNTLEMDNPQLDTRYGGINSPRPVIIDAHLKSSPELNVFKRDPVVFCSDSLDSELYKIV